VVVVVVVVAVARRFNKAAAGANLNMQQAFDCAVDGGLIRRYCGSCCTGVIYGADERHPLPRGRSSWLRQGLRQPWCSTGAAAAWLSCLLT
jgi:hypothetical protein